MTPPTAAAPAADRLRAFVQDAWDARIVPALTEYVRIPAKSPGFDHEWQAHGHLDRAVELILAHTWRPALAITGADGLPPIADGATCSGRGRP